MVYDESHELKFTYLEKLKLLRSSILEDAKTLSDDRGFIKTYNYIAKANRISDLLHVANGLNDLIRYIEGNF